MIFYKSTTNLGLRLLYIVIFRERFSRNFKIVLDEEI